MISIATCGWWSGGENNAAFMPEHREFWPESQRPRIFHGFGVVENSGGFRKFWDAKKGLAAAKIG
jgi:hypothetical protein